MIVGGGGWNDCGGGGGGGGMIVGRGVERMVWEGGERVGSECKKLHNFNFQLLTKTTRKKL